MEIVDFLWLDPVLEKLQRKHRVFPEEVEEALYNRPRVHRAEKGRYEGEDLYYGYGRSDAGRYLLVVFIYKKDKRALVVSARDMNAQEKRKYGSR